MPFGSAEPVEATIPEPPRLEGRRFASIEAALDDGPKTFEALMAAIGSRDGRDVVRELEPLRAAGRPTRDEQGRYLLGS